MSPSLETPIVSDLRHTPFLRTLLAVTLATGLSACTTLAQLGVGPDITRPGNRTTADVLSDMNVAQAVRVDIYRDAPAAKDAHVNVDVFYQAVLLTGEVPTAELKQQVGEIAKRFSASNTVHNELTVGPNRSVLSRVADTSLENRAAAILLTADNFRSSQSKVVAVDGTVYLMGKLSARESERAVQRLQALDGLSRIIKVVDLVPEPVTAPAATPEAAPAAGK